MSDDLAESSPPTSPVLYRQIMVRIVCGGFVEYHHVQIGTLSIVYFALGLVIAEGLWFLHCRRTEEPHPEARGCLTLLSLFLLFKIVTVRMIVSVDAETLRHRQPGTNIDITYSLREIAQAEADRIPWYICCGKRLTWDGDLVYNVSGSEVVRLDFVHGQTIFIGSDDSANLARVLSAGIGGGSEGELP